VSFRFTITIRRGGRISRNVVRSKKIGKEGREWLRRNYALRIAELPYYRYFGDKHISLKFNADTPDESMRIGSIIIRCYEFDKTLVFGQETPHYAPRNLPKGGWVVLRDPEGKGPNISLDNYPEKRTGKTA